MRALGRGTRRAESWRRRGFRRGAWQAYLQPDARAWRLRRRGVWPSPRTIAELPVPVPLFRFCQVGPLVVRRYDRRWPGVEEWTSMLARGLRP